MENNREDKNEIERGMRLAAELPDIMPDEADEQIKPVYKDIQQTLRVPIVNLIFRTLANYPDYFVKLWEQLSPGFRTKAFEQAADSLRRKALLEPASDVSGINLEKLDDLEKLRGFNDTIHYVLPKLLLVTTAFEKATFGADNEKDKENKESEDSQKIPLGAAEGTIKVEMVDPDKASDRVQALFKSIKERHGHPLVSSYFRGLGNWPDFLEQSWNRLQPNVGSSDYEERKNTLIRQSENVVRHMPLQQLKEAGLDEKQMVDVRAILAAFRLKFIPEMLLDAALIKAMLDGPEQASSSRFSVAEP
ncbi:hypothetical protein GCM10027443_32150 [Pontibacter brevis]